MDSLVTVFLGPGEGLGVDVSQGDVLVPLQVSHQNSDLGLHQTDPEGRHGDVFTNKSKESFQKCKQ